ncbi:MAG: hypothetical protein ACJ746_19220 [Bryobacteraceae bacterium]
MSILLGMKRTKRTSSEIMKSMLEKLSQTQKPKDKVASAKPVAQESPVKAPDLSHDAGGAYNADLSFLQQ